MAHEPGQALAAQEQPELQKLSDSLDGTVSLETRVPAWAFRLGLLAGWVTTGVFLALADDSRFLPYPAVGLAGWILFEKALETTPLLTHGGTSGNPRGLVTTALMVSHVSMGVFMLVAAMSMECSPFGPAGACIQRSEITYSLSWHSGLSRLLSRPVDLLADWLWRRYGGGQKRWSILVAPVMHADRVTGGGLGVAVHL